MGFCIACFLRDTTGALGFHSAAAVQYIRPEIVGLVLGSCILALATREFKPRGGSAPVTRFVIGMFVMIGCLMFLGCPFRMILGFFHPGFVGQPIAHTDGLWNALGMALAGFGCVLLGGCPLRQLVLAGEGNTDSAITIFGLMAGAAVAHNFGLASSGEGPTANGKIAVVIGFVVLIVIATVNSMRKSEA